MTAGRRMSINQTTAIAMGTVGLASAVGVGIWAAKTARDYTAALPPQAGKLIPTDTVVALLGTVGTMTGAAGGTALIYKFREASGAGAKLGLLAGAAMTGASIGALLCGAYGGSVGSDAARVRRLTS